MQQFFLPCSIRSKKYSDPGLQRKKHSILGGGKFGGPAHHHRKVSEPPLSQKPAEVNPVRVRRKKRRPSFKRGSLTGRKKSRQECGDTPLEEGRDPRASIGSSSVVSENLSGILLLRKESVTSYNGGVSLQ